MSKEQRVRLRRLAQFTYSQAATLFVLCFVALAMYPFVATLVEQAGLFSSGGHVATIPAVIPRPNPLRASDPFNTQFERYGCDQTDDPSLTKFRPLAFIIGVQKGGTTGLAQFLGKHPAVAYPEFESHVLVKKYDALEERNGSRCWSSCDFEAPMGDTVISARDIFSLYEKWYAEEGTLAKINAGKSYIDKTPEYLVASTRVPQRLLCAAPDAKINRKVQRTDPGALGPNSSEQGHIDHFV